MQSTSMRLPKTLYLELRKRAKETNEPAEKIMHRALRKELHEPDPTSDVLFHAASFYHSVHAAMEEFMERCGPNFGLKSPDPLRPRTPFNWSSLEAYRFLQALPPPCLAVIKSADAKIVWCNQSMTLACHKELDQIIGKSVDQLGVLTREDGGEVRDDIAEVITGGEPLESLEIVRLPERGIVMLRVHRFLFEPESGDGRRYLGDLSFEYSPLEDQRSGVARPRSDLHIPQFKKPFPDTLFSSLLRSASTAGIGIAIKDVGRRYLFANEAFAKRAGKTPESIVGTLIEANAKRPAAYRKAIMDADARVLADKVWMFQKHQFKDEKHPLVSLRFPIFGAGGQVERIGVLNGYFKVELQRAKSKK